MESFLVHNMYKICKVYLMSQHGNRLICLAGMCFQETILLNLTKMSVCNFISTSFFYKLKGKYTRWF